MTDSLVTGDCIYERTGLDCRIARSHDDLLGCDRSNCLLVDVQWDKENRHEMPWKPFRSYNYADRIALAKVTVKEMKITMPVLIDDLTSSASQAYFAWPDRSCLVDINGKIAYHGSAFKQSVRGEFFAGTPFEKAIEKVLANGGRFVLEQAQRSTAAVLDRKK